MNGYVTEGALVIFAHLSWNSRTACGQYSPVSWPMQLDKILPDTMVITYMAQFSGLIGDISYTSKIFCCLWYNRLLHPSHPPWVNLWNPRYCHRLVRVLAVRLVPNSACQQHAVRSRYTLMWCASRFCLGVCTLHHLYYPSSLHHQPSQLESPLLCWWYSTT